MSRFVKSAFAERVRINPRKLAAELKSQNRPRCHFVDLDPRILSSPGGSMLREELLRRANCSERRGQIRGQFQSIHRARVQDCAAVGVLYCCEARRDVAETQTAASESIRKTLGECS